MTESLQEDVGHLRPKKLATEPLLSSPFLNADLETQLFPIP